MSQYPEHEKLQKVADETQAVGEFLEWAEEKGIRLVKNRPGSEYRTYDVPWMPLLAEWAGIDQKKIDAEKEEMIAAIRKQNP